MLSIKGTVRDNLSGSELYITPLKGRYRSSHRRCSIKKGVLENFAKFTGKHLSQSLFFNKVAGLRLQLHWKRDSGMCNFIKKETLAQVFSCELCEIFQSTFPTEHIRTTASGDSIKNVLKTHYSKSDYLLKLIWSYRR